MTPVTHSIIKYALNALGREIKTYHISIYIVFICLMIINVTRTSQK